MTGPTTEQGLPAIDPAGAAFFLDFDGVLAPIAPTPDAAGMAPRTRAALARLAAGASGAVAVVSGRALADLAAKIADLPVSLAGSHGLERRGPGGAHASPVLGATATEALAEVAAFAAEQGLLFERKPAGGALHYRSRPELEAACLARVEAAAEAGGLRLVRGHMVAEATAAVADKGTAIRSFMAEAPFSGRRPVAIGDDVTDEDAFRAATDMGGVAIKIGGGATAATHRAADIDVFLNWFEDLTAGERPRHG